MEHELPKPKNIVFQSKQGNGEASIGNGSKTGQEDGQALAEQQEQDDDMTEKELSESEIEIAIANGEDKAVVAMKKTKVKRSLLKQGSG